jgi:dTDP-4-dehydrorhamnose reductase
MPVVEGLVMDCIVLTSKNTVMEEIAGPCAVYFDPCSPPDIADAIRKVVTGEVDAKHLLFNRDARLSAFSWYESARKMLAILTGKEIPAVKENVRSHEM